MRLILPFSFYVLSMSLALGLDDVEKFKERKRNLETFKTVKSLSIEVEANNKIEEFSKIQHPYLLSYDKKNQATAQKIMTQSMGKITSLKDDIIISHIESQLKKYAEIKLQRQNYLDSREKVEELKKRAGNSKNLQKYIQLMSNSTTTVQDAVIEGRYLLLSKVEKLIADDFKTNLYFSQREEGIQESLEKELKSESAKIDEDLKLEEQKISSILSEKELIDKEHEKFTKHIRELNDKHQFSWNVGTKSDKMGGFSCDPKINPKYYRFINYPNLVAFNNGKDFNTIVSLDKDNPKDFNQVYTCTPGSYGCFDKKAPALCELDSNCKIHLENALNSYKVEGYQAFKAQLFQEALERNKNDHFKEGNLISELFKEKKLSETDVRKLKELHDNVGEQLSLLKNTNPEEFYKEVKKKIDVLVETEKKIPTLSKHMQLGYIYMLQGIKTKTQEFKGQYYLEMNSFKFCPGLTETTKQYCESFGNYLKEVKKFDDVEEIENLTPDECPLISFRIPKNVLPSQRECTVKPIIEGMEDLFKIQEVLKKDN